MTPEGERLVRQSWKQLAPNADRFAECFYQRLFELDPEVRQLFTAADMVEQRRKFMDTLGEIVRTLDDPQRLVREVAASGRRHADYGIRTRDYATAGSALLWAMERELGDRFTPEVRAAWAEAYARLAAVMQQGASRGTPSSTG